MQVVGNIEGTRPTVTVNPETGTTQVTFTPAQGGEVTLMILGEDSATQMHDILTQLALDLENAVGMNAPSSGTVCLRCGVVIEGAWDEHAQSPEHIGEPTRLEQMGLPVEPTAPSADANEVSR